MQTDVLTFVISVGRLKTLVFVVTQPKPVMKSAVLPNKYVALLKVVVEMAITMIIINISPHSMNVRRDERFRAELIELSGTINRISSTAGVGVCREGFDKPR
jgi:hypothetical protein